MKKVITMILTLAIAISGMAVPVDTANAEAVPGTETPFSEATATPIPTTNPTQTPIITEQPTENPVQKQMRVKVREGAKDSKAKVYASGKSVPVTKGFKLFLSVEDPNGKKERRYPSGKRTYLGSGVYRNEMIIVKTDYEGEVKWTSSKPAIASVSVTGVVKGKKFGKTTITANYNGTTSRIIVNVKKNKYTAKPEKTGSTWGDVGKSGIISIYFDKKGNIIYEIYHKKKLTKKGRKNPQIKRYKIGTNGFSGYYLHYATIDGKIGCLVTVKDYRGKVVAKTRQKILDMIDTKNKVYIKKYKINKKQIKRKRKDIDLRCCKIFIDGEENAV